MCGRYQFTAEQCEEIRQIAEAIQRKYGAGAWTPGEIRPSNHAPVLLDGAGEAPVSGQRPQPALSDPVHRIL